MSFTVFVLPSGGNKIASIANFNKANPVPKTSIQQILYQYLGVKVRTILLFRSNWTEITTMGMSSMISTILIFVLFQCFRSVHSFKVEYRPKAFSTTRLLLESDQQKDRLKQLGIPNEELTPNRRIDNVPNVRVDLLQDVDPITLTAIGFSAIAFNFFVLANGGDGGIASVVATIINTWDN